MRRLAALAALAPLAACGAGSLADDVADDEVPSSAYCDPVADWSPAAAAQEAEILRLVNERRAAGATCGGPAMPAAPPLEAHPALRCAARVHTLDMATRGYFSHTSPEGEDPWDRMTRAGYAWRTAGENIAAGNATAEATMAQWMGSAGHCRNIMSRDFVHLGVGHVAVDRLWTQVFGAPR